MNADEKIFVAGHRGLVGSALVRNLQSRGYHNLLLRGHDELDLLNADAVDRLFANEKPDFVFLGAAKVGGIHANNTYPAEFIESNLGIQTNVINAAHAHGVKRLLDEFNLTHEQAATAIGRSRSATSNLLRLLNLANPVQTMLLAGDIDMGHARALLSVDAATQIQMANQIIAKRLSVRETEKMVCP